MTDKITIDRAVVEKALGALVRAEMMHEQPNQSAQDALRAALEQPQVNSPEIPEGWKLVPVKPTEDMLNSVAWPGCAATDWEHMLAAAPQPPVVEQPQVEQEPVAYYVMNGAALFQLFGSKSQADALAYDLQKRHDLSGSPAHFHVVPLYTHPQPKREPLTDEQIVDSLIDLPVQGTGYFIRIARAIERAHGIGGEA